MLAKLSVLNLKGPYLRAFFSQGQSKLLELLFWCPYKARLIQRKINERAFFPWGQNKRSLIVRCPYYVDIV